MENEVIVKIFGENEITKIAPEEEASKQIKSVDSFGDMLSLIEVPKYDPSVWASQLENNTRLMKSCRTYSRNTVGLGFTIQPYKDMTYVKESDLTDEELKIFNEEKKRIVNLVKTPNEEMSFTEIMEIKQIDKFSTGNAYIEIVRNLKNDIVKLYHVQSSTIRIMKNGDGFVQIKGMKKVYFKKFGDERLIDCRDGKEKKRNRI